MDVLSDNCSHPVSLIRFNYSPQWLIRCFLTKRIKLWHQPQLEMFRGCHSLSSSLHVHKVYHLPSRVIRCRIYTGLSIGMPIERHLASIIRRIDAIFQPWIPGNDSFQINGAKRNTTLLGERQMQCGSIFLLLLSLTVSAQLSGVMQKVRDIKRSCS